jgi:hypothetical protein
MNDPKTLAEHLDAAESGEEFGGYLWRLFAYLEKEMEDDERLEP